MAEYRSHEQYQHELSKAVQPYRYLLQSELKTADYNRYWSEQAVTTVWEYARAHECDHVERKAVSWTLSNGVERATLQCVACGHKHSSGVRKADYPGTLPPIDEGLIYDARSAWHDFNSALQEAYKEACEQFEEQKNKLTEFERLARDKEWWAKYSAYLKTDKWYDKRERVLERDGHVCQACLRREATSAHHLTYEHVFDEPLFDLISVCTLCHHKLHPHMKEASYEGIR